MNLLNLLVVFISLFSFSSFSRWSTPADMPIEYLQFDRSIDVQKDGSYTTVLKQQIRILNEAGRRDNAVITLAFDKSTSHLTVLEAKSTFEGQEDILSAKDIEMKPLASDPIGVTESYQILIPFKHVNVGTVISLTTKKVVQKEDLDAYFSFNADFSGAYYHKASLTVNSALPLTLKTNDAHDCLSIKENKSANGTHIEVSLKKPTLIGIIMEGSNQFLEPTKSACISLSTETTYDRMGAHFSKRYEDILTGPMPTKLEHIAKKAGKAPDAEQQMAEAIALLIKDIHYLGSWNSADGHYFPRTLEAICASGFGDCKEFSVCLTAILRTLGFKAYPALITRGNLWIDDKSLPSMGDFNHVIVKAITPQGTPQWLDPTNDVAMARGIFPDISHRPALVLSGGHLEITPAVDFKTAKFTKSEEITLSEDDTIKTLTELCEEGECAIQSTSALLSTPAEIFKESLIRNACHTSDPKNPEVLLPQGTSCKVQPNAFTLRYEENVTPLLTNLGRAFPINSGWAGLYMAVKKLDVGALFIGTPETMVKKTLFKNRKLDNPASLNFAITSQWFNASRSITQTDKGVEVIETYENLVEYIPSADLQTPEFTALKAKLQLYCYNVALILK